MISRLHRPEYLFIRILEACNADCFMCGYRLSKDRYRFSRDTLKRWLPDLVEQGVKYIRFTGGEPLLHRELVSMVKDISEYQLQTSLITNGWILADRLAHLLEAGLRQVIVSLDGPTAEIHDRIRGSGGLFARALSGLRAARDSNLRTRVNSVCGPHNFRHMPALQQLLTDEGVGQWELSALKLDPPTLYSSDEAEEARAVKTQLYDLADARGALRPMGKPWCGESEREQMAYFVRGVPPRPDDVCEVVHRVRYLDARNGLLFPCSLLPHRENATTVGVRLTLNELPSLDLHAPALESKASYYYEYGPTQCTGCSATAAGFGNDIALSNGVAEWAY